MSNKIKLYRSKTCLIITIIVIFVVIVAYNQMGAQHIITASDTDNNAVPSKDLINKTIVEQKANDISEDTSVEPLKHVDDKSVNMKKIGGMTETETSFESIIFIPSGIVDDIFKDAGYKKVVLQEQGEEIKKSGWYVPRDVAIQYWSKVTDTTETLKLEDGRSVTIFVGDGVVEDIPDDN